MTDAYSAPSFHDAGTVWDRGVLMIFLKESYDLRVLQYYLVCLAVKRDVVTALIDDW